MTYVPTRMTGKRRLSDVLVLFFHPLFSHAYLSECSAPSSVNPSIPVLWVLLSPQGFNWTENSILQCFQVLWFQLLSPHSVISEMLL